MTVQDCKIGMRVVATDKFGNYYNEHGTVVDFGKNILGQDLVNVKLDSTGWISCFYPHELRSE